MTSYNFSGCQKPSHVVLRGRRFLSLFVGTLCLSSLEVSGVALAKTPGKTYCFRNTCHRVKTLNETKALVGRDLKINASYYDGCSKDRFNSCGLTSSGEVFKPHKADNAASSILPDGTVALIWSEVSGEAIVLRINNAGPYWGNRKLDLSAAAARKLGMKGVEEVTLRVVKAPSQEEARFEKNRSYDPVIGPLGKFASLELAQKAMSKIRSDGLKSSSSLASLQETIPSSGPDVKIASLEETDPQSSFTYLKDVVGSDFQPITSSIQADAQTLMPNQSILSPFSRVKDFLSNFKPQILSLDAEDDFIEQSPLKVTTSPEALRTAELSEAEYDSKGFKSAADENFTPKKARENTASPLDVTSSTTSSEAIYSGNKKSKVSKSDASSSPVRRAFKDNMVTPSNLVENKNIINKKVNRKSSPTAQNYSLRKQRSDITIASLASGAGEKNSSQKSKKKDS